MRRPQPYRIAWPAQPSLKPETNTALARQFQNSDEMFQILFDDFGNEGSGTPGPPGPAGPAGPVGPAGPSGGPAGPAGPTGATGPAGPQGIQGIPGVAGAQGLQGVPGMDAVGGDDSGEFWFPYSNAGTGTSGSSGSSTVVEAVGITIDAGASIVSTGVKGYRQITKAGTITGWSILSKQVGSITFDVVKSPFSGYPPTTSIVAAAPPTMTADDGVVSTSLPGWTTAVAVGDVIGFKVTSATGISWVTLELQITVSAGGAAGPAGPAGPTGATGPQGLAGLAGPIGPQGDPGDDGADGAMGPMGLTGPMGPAGATGATGATGLIGPMGPQGDPGVDGLDGADGATGPRGATGATGATGPQGIVGVPGPPGLDGSGDGGEDPGTAFLGTNVYPDASALLGTWIDQPFNAAHYSATGGGTWTVGSAAVLTNRYTLIGKTLHWKLYISWFSGSNVAAGTLTTVQIALPGGFTWGGGPTMLPVAYTIDGSGTFSYAYAANSGSVIQFNRLVGAAGANWTAGAIGILTQLTLEIA